jgi:hypothetical protein
MPITPRRMNIMSIFDSTQLYDVIKHIENMEKNDEDI